MSKAQPADAARASFLSIFKPGIVVGNAVSLSGGYFLGAKGTLDVPVFYSTLVGTSLLVACGALVNNWIDRDIDPLMERTRNRATARNLVSGKAVLTGAAVLGGAGALLLARFSSALALGFTLAGLFIYLVPYSLWLKRRSLFGTLVGSLSGGTPPLVGYCAATGALDPAAWLLFALLCLWQLPHFYAIAILRQEDFAAAALPVLPRRIGPTATKLCIALAILLFAAAALALACLGYAGALYAWVTGLASLAWLGLGLTGFRMRCEKTWARSMFLASIAVISLVALLLSLDARPAVAAHPPPLQHAGG